MLEREMRAKDFRRKTVDGFSLCTKNAARYRPREVVRTRRWRQDKRITQEISALQALLLSQRTQPPVDSTAIDWARANTSNGRALFGELRCVSCHAVNGRGGTMGPELTRIGDKVRALFPHTTTLELLADPKANVVITEGEYKTLVIAEALQKAERKRKFAVIGLQGVNGGWHREKHVVSDPDGGHEKKPTGPPRLIDDLQAIAADYLKQRQEEIARCEAIIREKAQVLLSPPGPRPQGAGTEPAYGHK